MDFPFLPRKILVVERIPLLISSDFRPEETLEVYIARKHVPVSTDTDVTILMTESLFYNNVQVYF